MSEDQTPQSVVSEDQGMRHDTNQYSDNTMCQDTEVQMELLKNVVRMLRSQENQEKKCVLHEGM